MVWIMQVLTNKLRVGSRLEWSHVGCQACWALSLVFLRHQLHGANKNPLTMKRGVVWSTECVCSYGNHVYLGVSQHQPYSSHTQGDSLRAASIGLTSPTDVHCLFGVFEKHTII